ncbi:hypothetical protein HON22_01810 [Candidatus Peregrinibacteria bacterium]|nr:hypothetical protein [Candidatus Peregrinibacteria bacterium]
MDNQVNISAQSSVISQQSGIQSPLFSKEGLGEISAEELRKLIEGSRLSEENKRLAFEILEQNMNEEVLKSFIAIVKRAEEKFDVIDAKREALKSEKIKEDEEMMQKVKKLELEFDAKIAIGYQKLQKHIEEEMTKIEEKQEEALLEEVKNL